MAWLETLHRNPPIQWCRSVGINPLEVKRPHIEFFARHLEEERGNRPASVARRLHTLRSFYRVATADGYVDSDPALMVRMPKVNHDESRVLHLDRVQLGAMIQAARRSSPEKEALITLMGHTPTEWDTVSLDGIRWPGK